MKTLRCRVKAVSYPKTWQNWITACLGTSVKEWPADMRIDVREDHLFSMLTIKGIW